MRSKEMLRAETLRVAKFAVLYKENQKAWKTTAGN